MIKTSLIIGTILVWLAIILGAFGAHFLKTILDTNQLASIETGIRYQLIQGIAIVVLSLNSDKFKFPLKKILNSMIIGLCLFSFSIFFDFFSDPRKPESSPKWAKTQLKWLMKKGFRGKFSRWIQIWHQNRRF